MSDDRNIDDFIKYIKETAVYGALPDTEPRAIEFGTFGAYKIKLESARVSILRARAVKKTGALRYTLSKAALVDCVIVRATIEAGKVTRE